MLKIKFGHGFVVFDRVYRLECPNTFQGIGDIEVGCPRLHQGLWTGDTHLRGDRFRFHFGNITEIQEHVDFEDNSEGAPVTVWKYEPPFIYEQFFEAAKIVLSKVVQV